MLRQLVADLERRLAAETRRNAALDERLTSAKAAIAEERSARMNARARTWRAAPGAGGDRGIGAGGVPGGVPGGMPGGCGDEASSASLGRAWRASRCSMSAAVRIRSHTCALSQSVRARLSCTTMAASEHHLNLLAGLASQADLVVFPVDCISHHAANAAKQLCRQAGKRFIPLRSASATSLLAALRRPEVAGLADAGD